MVDKERIDSYLIQMERPFEQLGEATWRLDDPDDAAPPVFLWYEPPIVYVRLKIMDLPQERREALYRKLLEYNASGIAFGAYAVDGEEVVLVDTLRAENLDKDELQASIESLILAATEHYHALVDMVGTSAAGTPAALAQE